MHTELETINNTKVMKKPYQQKKTTMKSENVTHWIRTETEQQTRSYSDLNYVAEQLLKKRITSNIRPPSFQEDLCMNVEKTKNSKNMMLQVQPITACLEGGFMRWIHLRDTTSIFTWLFSFWIVGLSFYLATNVDRSNSLYNSLFLHYSVAFGH